MSHDAAEISKRMMAELYSRVAATYAERGPPWFAYAGRRLVELTNVDTGDVVLDLGTGRGAVLLPAAQRVGPSGRAVGIDVAAGMVQRTAAALAERRLRWASVRLMDADHLEFPDKSFTHVLCSYAVFFFPDVAKVLEEIRRVLRPGGIVGFAFERETDPRWRWYEASLRARGAFERVVPAPGNGAIRRQGALVGHLTSAGFDNPHEVLEHVELFSPDADTWWESLWTHGTRRALEALTPEELADLKAHSLERAQEMATPAGLPRQHHFVFVIARREGLLRRGAALDSPMPACLSERLPSGLASIR
jgi:ubiquinone/menaquinone biosynthesis C-methylase UbiE